MSEFIIPIQVGEERDLYTGFDPSGLSFNTDLIAYFSDYIEERKLGETVCIEVRSESMPDMERLRKAFLLYIEKSSRRNRREKIKYRINAVRLLVIGIVFILAGLLLSSHVNEVVAAIISTIGSFSVWEASAIWIEKLPVLKKRERLLQMFAETEFRYAGSGEDEET